jgi:hypothetical protein
MVKNDQGARIEKTLSSIAVGMSSTCVVNLKREAPTPKVAVQLDESQQDIPWQRLSKSRR